MLYLQVLKVFGKNYISQEDLKAVLSPEVLSRTTLNAVFMFDTFYYEVPEALKKVKPSTVIDIDSFMQGITEINTAATKYKVSVTERSEVFTVQQKFEKYVFIGLSALESLEDRYNKRLFMPIIRVKGKVYIACNKMLGGNGKKYAVVA